MAAPSAASRNEKATAATTGGGLDTDKLNGLMANLDKRLAGGLHGEFFEQGSKLEDSKRHGQLDALFALRKELEALKKKEETVNKVADPEVEQKSKKPAPANANMIATIRNVVQEQLSGMGRDLSIANERLEERLKKAEDRPDISNTKLKALGAKLSKAEDQNSVTSTKLKTLEVKLKATEYQNAAMNAKVNALEANLQKADECNRKLSNTMSVYEKTGKVSQSMMEKASSDLEWALTELSRLGSLCSELDRRVKAADARREADQKNTFQQPEKSAPQLNGGENPYPYHDGQPDQYYGNSRPPPPLRSPTWVQGLYGTAGYWLNNYGQRH